MKYKILKIQTQRCRNKRKRLNIFKFFICVFYILFLIFGFIGGSASAKPKKDFYLKPRE